MGLLCHLLNRRDASGVKNLGFGSQVIAYAFKKTDGCKGRYPAATASGRNSGIGPGPDDGYRSNPLFAEWQQFALILEQHHAFARGLEGLPATFLVVAWDQEIGLVAIEPAKFGGGT